MRSGVSLSVSSSDRQRLEAIVADGNRPQKHVWRARIILLSGDGPGTAAIMTGTGKSKTCVWRWQERFMEEGVEGLLRDRTRPHATGGSKRWIQSTRPASIRSIESRQVQEKGSLGSPSVFLNARIALEIGAIPSAACQE